MRLGSLARKVGTVAAGLGLVLAGLPAGADVSGTAISLPEVVSDDPVNWTPNVENGAVNALVQVGDTIFAGGSFTRVSPAGTDDEQVRYRLVAFSATTGELISGTPSFGRGYVWSLATDGTNVYAGGSFETVNGTDRPALVKFDAATGAVDTTFRPRLVSKVSAAAVTGGRLLIGGEFKGRLKALDLTTGADTGYARFAFRSSLGPLAGPVGIYRFALSPDGTRLVVIGNFTSIDRRKHPRAAMFRLGRTTATLDPWYYAGLGLDCRAKKVPNYLRGVDFSPGGAYFVLVSTGKNPRVARDRGYAVCDAVARFSTTNPTPKRPQWINYTGGDTVHSVAATGGAVYVQGHFRWVDNPYGDDDRGRGAHARSAIAALDTRTGKALPWNPGKTRGVGGKVFLATPAGLWVGSDTERFALERRARIAFLPTP